MLNLSFALTVKIKLFFFNSSSFNEIFLTGSSFFCRITFFISLILSSWLSSIKFVRLYRLWYSFLGWDSVLEFEVLVSALVVLSSSTLKLFIYSFKNFACIYTKIATIF